ncbi:MAG TPA: hypothetical protein VFA34_01495 [Actinomycetota bacterium]|jgi:hypothetical protein|nr:hypothetical protein [Actinomycetota bacterium]
MNPTTDVEQISAAEGRGTIALWFGILGAPVAWATQFTANYLLEEWLTCAPASSTPGSLWGIGIERWVVAITTALLVVAIASLLVSLSCYRRLTDDTTVGGRARWMAIAGVINSAIFIVPITMSYASPLILSACRSSS